MKALLLLLALHGRHTKHPQERETPRVDTMKIAAIKPNHALWKH